MNLITLLATLLAFTSATTLAARVSGGQGNARGHVNGGGGGHNNNNNNATRICRDTFRELCEGPCKNTTTTPLDQYDCLADCFTANDDKLIGCAAPDIPRNELKKTNCTDVFRVRCDHCKNTSDIVRLECSLNCTKNKLTSFRECRQNKTELPGGDDAFGKNCSSTLRSKCRGCFKLATMEAKIQCLAACTTSNGTSNSTAFEPCRGNSTRGHGDEENDDSTNGTTKAPRGNCNETLALCPGCTDMSGLDKLSCYIDCKAIKDRRCVFPAGFPSNLFPASANCTAAISQMCTSCTTADDELKTQLKCLGDCTRGIPACQPRSRKDCVEAVCEPLCKNTTGMRRTSCAAQCALSSAVTACVRGTA